MLTWSRLDGGDGDSVSGSAILQAMQAEAGKGCVYAKAGGPNPHASSPQHRRRALLRRQDTPPATGRWGSVGLVASRSDGSDVDDGTCPARDTDQPVAPVGLRVRVWECLGVREWWGCGKPRCRMTGVPLLRRRRLFLTPTLYPSLLPLPSCARPSPSSPPLASGLDHTVDCAALSLLPGTADATTPRAGIRGKPVSGEPRQRKRVGFATADSCAAAGGAYSTDSSTSVAVADASSPPALQLQQKPRGASSSSKVLPVDAGAGMRQSPRDSDVSSQGAGTSARSDPDDWYGDGPGDAPPKKPSVASSGASKSSTVLFHKAVEQDLKVDGCFALALSSECSGCIEWGNSGCRSFARATGVVLQRRDCRDEAPGVGLLGSAVASGQGLQGLGCDGAARFSWEWWCGGTYS